MVWTQEIENRIGNYLLWAKPFVKIGDDLPPMDELRGDLDQKVERRVKRRMCGQATHAL